MAVPFSSLLKKQKIGKKKIKSALTALTSEREELGQMEEDKEIALGVFDTKKETALGQIETDRTEALGDLPNQLQTLKEGKDPALAAVQKSKTSALGSWDEKTKTGSGLEYGKGSALSTIQSDAINELSLLTKKIGTWDEKTGTGTGLTSDYMEAQGSYNTALSAYKGRETAFSESDLGQKMSGFKDKYKTYDPSAAQNYSKQLTGEMKADENWGAYQKSTEWRNRLDTSLKKHGWNPEDFYISQNEKGEITRHGVGVKNPQGWLVSKDDKVGGRNVWDVMYEHAKFKNYFSEVEGMISEADTEYESQHKLAYGEEETRDIYETFDEWKTRKVPSYSEYVKDPKFTRKQEVTQVMTGANPETFEEYRKRTGIESKDAYNFALKGGNTGGSDAEAPPPVKIIPVYTTQKGPAPESPLSESDYYSEFEGEYSEASESGDLLVTGQEVVLPEGGYYQPTDYEVFVDDSEKDLKTLKKSDTAFTEAETALGSWDPETKTGSGALGELGTKTGTWDTKYTTEEKQWDKKITATTTYWDKETKKVEDKYDTTDLDEKISGINTTWDTKKTTTGAKWDADKLTAEGEWDTKIGTQKTDISQIYEPAHIGATTALTALTARIKKYRLLGLADEGPKKSSTYKKPQMGYGAGYLRRSA